jgi:hypothetical protein
MRMSVICGDSTVQHNISLTPASRNRRNSYWRTGHCRRPQQDMVD